MPAPVHHSINYIEIAVTDLQAAKDFYGAAFQWEFTDYGPEYVGIRSKDGDGEIGGFCVTDQSKAGSVLVILYSQDLESSVQAVLNAGGKIVQEIFAFPGGRRFHFTDPSSNELAVWSDK